MIKIGRVMRSYAMISVSYSDLVRKLNIQDITKTPDGIDLNDPTIDGYEVNKVITSIKQQRQ